MQRNENPKNEIVKAIETGNAVRDAALPVFFVLFVLTVILDHDSLYTMNTNHGNGGMKNGIIHRTSA